MITFRYHIVSLAAVLLALAAGIALGSGPLDRTASAISAAEPESAPADPAVAAFEEAYAERTSSSLLEGVLSERSVVVVTVPSADEAEVAGVRDSLTEAGAAVSAEVGLAARMLDPGNRQFVEQVASQVAEELPERPEGEGYQLAGAVLAEALIGEAGATPPEESETVLSAFAEGNLVTGDAPDSLADLVVVIGGDASVSANGEVINEIVAALDAAGNGAVLAGPAVSSDGEGVVAAVRDAGIEVSTVDVTDLPAGRTVVPLALASEADGTSGAWGTARSVDGALPSSG